MSANRLKLNADQTELLWAGSKDGLASVGSNGPTLSVSQRASTFVCSASRYRPTSVWTSTSLLFVRTASTGFVS